MTTPDPPADVETTTYVAGEAEPVHGAQLRVRVDYPNSDAVVLTVDGEVDAATIDHLERIFWPRLSAQVTTIVVDLTGVEFLGVPGLHLLHQAHLRTQTSSTALRVVANDHETLHHLHVAGLDLELDWYPTVQAALGG